MSASPKKKFTTEECKVSIKSSFISHIKQTIDRKIAAGKCGTAKNYRCTLNSFLSFLSQTSAKRPGSIRFSDITPALIADYQTWLAAKGICLNSISFYMRNLRSLYNAAAEMYDMLLSNPFRKACTRIEKTAKRAVTSDDIRRIKYLDLHGNRNLERARDIFMFLFYCRGMSFIDAAFLNINNICCNEIRYRRHKTGQELRIGINSHINDILAKWSSEMTMRSDENAPSGCKTNGFIAPILGGIKDNAATAPHIHVETSRREYDTALRRTNRCLKQIAALAGIPVNLTTYVSRHSWASIAKSKGIPTSTISDAMGHNSERTTQIYLATISDDKINLANDTVLDGI